MTATRTVRLGEALAGARAAGRPALACYYPVGYPTLTASRTVLHALARHCDILEVGLPHHTPVLDGPEIRTATATALARGVRIRHLLSTLAGLARTSPAALLVMSYWQPIARYGPERFAAELAAAGATGILLPDLPDAEAHTWLDPARAHALDTVPLAPGTDPATLARLRATASGMVYTPAARGLTGSTGPLAADLPDRTDALRAAAGLPVAVGVGIASPHHAHAAAQHADCVVVGSALVRAARHSPGTEPAAAARLAADLMAAITPRGATPMPLTRPSAQSTPRSDQALAAFLSNRIAETDTTGCTAERRALAGIRTVLAEFQATYLRAHEYPPDDYILGQVDALRWALQCTAAAAFSHHPDLPHAVQQSTDTTPTPAAAEAAAPTP
ncbi:tryptophan synthase subunit alpha [Streptomyces sp. NPDC006984]|uniref:tryptophan synthase subunit alpha n=1 Tax=Streptomyces sp. NPDC006984 TaxID=3155463 RepID=UPI0033C08A57